VRENDKKLADTFSAIIITIAINPEKLESVFEQCLGLGLRPNVRGYDEKTDQVLFEVIVPCGKGPEIFKKKMSTLGGRVRQALKTELICPLPKPPTLLSKVQSVEVCGTEYFLPDEKDCQEANIGHTSPNFNGLFGRNPEKNVPNIVIATHHLEKRSSDDLIIAELGPHAEISLAHLFALIKKQSKGKKGILLVDAHPNVAFIRDINGNFWIVDASWSITDEFWIIQVYSTKHSDGWETGCQILSHDF